MEISQSIPVNHRNEELDNLKEYCKDENKIGEGGNGVVYRGRFKDQDVAIKRIDSKNVTFTDEYVLQVALSNHEYIIGCYDISRISLYAASHK